jgi:hypothetical protein
MLSRQLRAINYQPSAISREPPGSGSNDVDFGIVLEAADYQPRCLKLIAEG